MKRRRGCPGRVGVLAALCGACALIPAGAARAQGGSDEPEAAPASAQSGSSIEPAESVLKAIEAPYLNDQERADKRVLHGLWTTQDIERPAARARAALTAGVYDDPSLDDPQADALDRAEARVARGDPEQALELLEGEQSVRGARVRAEALEQLGRFAQAREAVMPAVRALSSRRAADAEELVEGVMATWVLARLEGRPADDYRTMLDLLVRGQQELDRLSWHAVAAQAALLYDKDNSGEARQAALQALSLNPTCAAAWRVMGEICVDSFDFPRAEAVASELDKVHARFTGDASVRHPLGQLVLARAWLRQNDPEFARQHTARALARHPAMREALALDVAAVAMTYDVPETERLLSAFDALSPGSPLALYWVGKALSENRQYARAADYLGRAVDRLPNWPPPGIELGLLEMQSGRDALALTALRKAVALDPFNVRAVNSLRLVEDLSAYKTFESEHFVVRCQPGVDEVMAREMPPILEQIHRDNCGALDFEPPVKTTIELHPDHQTFAVRITGMTGVHTIAASTGPVIAMEAPKVGKQHKGPYDWVRVIRHEYVHTVTLARTDNRIPHWFTEAAAVYLEAAPRDYSTCQLLAQALDTKSLFDLKQINIAFVRPKRASDRAQAYAQGHWMYQYIVSRWGTRAPLELMDRYRDGVREARAMREVLGIEPEEFLKDFEAWARLDAATWGLLPTPSMRDLLVEAFLSDPVRQAEVTRHLSTLARSTDRSAAGMAASLGWSLDVPEPTPEIVEALLERYPTHPDLLEVTLSLALAGAGEKATPEMSTLLERYAQARPVDPMPHRHLARLFLASAEPTRAIPHLEFLDVREQNSPAYAIELARLYAAEDQWDSAGAKAERATQIAPFDPGNREFAASVAIQRGDLTTAERHVQALVDLEPAQQVHKQRLERVKQLRAGG